MALAEIACIGHSIRCTCSSCDKDAPVGADGFCRGGTLTSNGEFIQVEGKNVAVTGTIATADCGHTGIVRGQSTLMKIHNKEVARKGDPIEGFIVGKIVEGCDFLKIE